MYDLKENNREGELLKFSSMPEMRSKGRARKLTKTGEEMASDEEMYDAEKPTSPDHRHHAHSPGSNHHHHHHHHQQNNSDTSMEEQPPVYIPEDVVLPPEFELRESRILEAGLGVFSLVAIPMGEKFGPFVGEERPSACDTQYAWEIVDDTGKVKCWIDASEPGTGNWMKYVRSASVLDEQNMVAVQVDNKVFYKVIRPIQAGEELMVLKEAAFPDQDGIPFQLIEEQQYNCPDCKDVFRSKVALRRHQKYACNATTIYSNMNQQQQMQNGCNNNTTPGAPLMPVMDSNENDKCSVNEEEILMEESIDYSGSERSETPPPDEMDRNEEDYSENRQFKCTDCPRSFNWKSNLVRHLSDHENDRYFPCENCDKSFSDPSNLQRHIRTQHVGARSHACPECGKTFATSSGLKQHTHIHSSIKPFTCEVCLKSYTQFSNLCRHKRMHADCRTQLKCTTCGQMFATITSLNKHRRFCHGSSHMMNGHVPPPVLPMQQGLRTNGPIIGGAGTPSATSPNLMGMGIFPPTSSALHPANIAQLYNLQLTQQAALLQNNLLAYSGDKSAPAHPYLMGYPNLAGQATPLLATGLANGNGLLKPGNSPNNPVSTEEWLKHYTASKSPSKNEDREKVTENEKSRKKLESDFSDGSDIDNVSTPTGSDLDSTSGSDLDSENEDNEKSLKKKIKELKYGSCKLNNVNVEKAFLPPESGPSEPIKAIANIADKYFGGALPPGIITPRMVPPPRIIPGQTNGIPLHKVKEEPLPKTQDGAFDLSKKIESLKSPQVSPVTKSTRDDQPLDLSMPSKKRDSDDDVKKETETINHKAPLLHSSEQERALQQQLNLAYAKPIPFSMDPIYRVGNGFPMMPYKFMRMDYASQEMLMQQAQAAAAFAGFRKFEQYDPSKISPVLPTKPSVSSPPQRGSFTVNSLLYANSADKMVIRSKDRYTCKFCGKLFPRSANLTRHLRTHTGEQPYSCKYCDRSFSISSNLQRHVRNIHNKEKPFKCPLCDRCFGQQTNLDRHLKKHENERAEGSGSLSPITPIKDDLATKLKDAKLNGTPLPPTPNLNLEEKDETYFDEIKNFITDGKSGRVSKELLPPDIRRVQPVLPRQVQSPSVGSSSPDGPKKDEDDLAADLKQLPKLEEMETARYSPSPRPLEVDETRDDSTPPPPDVTQEAMLTDALVRKRTSPSPLPSPPPSPEKNHLNGQDHNGMDDDESEEPINKRPRLRDEITSLKSFCPSPPAEASEVLDSRENRTRHSKMQAYSLMMAQYDEDHHERRRQQLHSHHPPTHTATAV